MNQFIKKQLTMNDINIVKDNIKEMIINFDPKHKFVKLGNITLDSCYIDTRGKECDNITLDDIRYIDDKLYAISNFGYICLDDRIMDIDDWYMIEDIITDIVSSVKCFN